MNRHYITGRDAKMNKIWFPPSKISLFSEEQRHTSREVLKWKSFIYSQRNHSRGETPAKAAWRQQVALKLSPNGFMGLTPTYLRPRVFPAEVGYVEDTEP